MGKKREIELLEKVVGMQECEIERLEATLQSEINRKIRMEMGEVAKPNVNRIGETSWAKAPIETVMRMLRDHYNGKLNIYDFWGIGDEREIHLGGKINETVTFVLTDKAVYTIAGTSDRCAFTVDQKNVLADTSHCMNENGSNEGGWENCDMRKWLDAAYTNALSKEYDGLFKDFVIENGIVDKFSLRSEMEMFGKTIYGNDIGGRQIEYYKQTRNRIKLDGSDSAESRWYWERSPYSGYSGIFCFVISDGSAISSDASTAGGIAPFGCI